MGVVVVVLVAGVGLEEVEEVVVGGDFFDVFSFGWEVSKVGVCGGGCRLWERSVVLEFCVCEECEGVSVVFVFWGVGLRVVGIGVVVWCVL